jgi:hypothetical protein
MEDGTHSFTLTAPVTSVSTLTLPSSLPAQQSLFNASGTYLVDTGIAGGATNTMLFASKSIGELSRIQFWEPGVVLSGNAFAAVIDVSPTVNRIDITVPGDYTFTAYVIGNDGGDTGVGITVGGTALFTANVLQVTTDLILGETFPDAMLWVFGGATAAANDTVQVTIETSFDEGTFSPSLNNLGFNAYLLIEQR